MKNEVNKDYTVDLRTKMGLGEPTLYQIIIHHDDFTPMEFVVAVLEKFFYMDRRAATQVMLAARTEGRATCGFYTREVAESKIAEIIDYARTHQYPLVCDMEVASE